VGVRHVAAVIVAAVTLLPLCVAAEQRPVAGARCYGTSLPLGSNLPLGTSSSRTDVVDVHVIRSAAGPRVAAWYYSNREGDRFVQIQRGQERYLASLFSASGAKVAAASAVGNRPLGFIPVRRSESVEFERYTRSHQLMQNCFIRPLGKS
jgi:hypothetical protein